MKVDAGSVVTLTYDILDQGGEIIESSDLSGPISFLVGKGAIIKGLDKQVTGMQKGEEKSFELPPEEAFGRPEDGPTREVPRSNFPDDAKLAVGERFEAGASGQQLLLEVVDKTDEKVTVRMMHPLAGQTISMTIKVVSVRAATAAEQEAGRSISAPPPPPPPAKKK